MADLRWLGGPLVALMLASCSGGTPTPDVTVGLQEYAVAVPRELEAGKVVLEVVNSGHAHHNLTICPADEDGGCGERPLVHRMLQRPEDARDPGFYPDEADSLVIGKRWSTLIEVELEPGPYRFFCAIIGHAGRGMEAVVDVVSPADA